MKKFKNLSTGLIEEVNNKAVIEQYEKYPEHYEEVKASNKGAEKTEKTGKGGEKVASNKGAEKTDKVTEPETPVDPENKDEEPKAE